jgi:hypothetical protein
VDHCWPGKGVGRHGRAGRRSSGREALEGAAGRRLGNGWQLSAADGSRYLGVCIFELRDGKVLRETDYYAQPFQAPEWRAQWAERM